LLSVAIRSPSLSLRLNFASADNSQHSGNCQSQRRSLPLPLIAVSSTALGISKTST
jgi:hypothetical protein